MIKKFLVLLLFIAFPVLLFANYQKYYEVSSKEWKIVSWVTKYAGVTGPSSNGPITGYQLSDAIDRAENILGKGNTHIIEARKSIEGPEILLGSKDSGYINLFASINPEVYLQTNGIDPLFFEGGNTIFDYDWYIADSKHRSPIIDLGFELGAKDIFYGDFVYNFTRAYYESDVWNRNLLNNASTYHTENYPFRSGISIGNRNLSFIAAKAGVSMGEGYTGNTAIGDNFDYQEFIKASFFSPNVGLFINITNFDSSHSKEVTSPYEFLYASFSGYLQLRHNVSMEFNLFNRGLISVSLINLLDTTSSFDLRMVNPFYILHNMFNYTEGTIFESNNMLSLSFTIPIVSKLSAHFQFTLDQSQTEKELDSIGERNIDPNAFSFLTNISKVGCLKTGRYELFLESVYNSPCMYLNQKYYKSDGTITAKIPESDPLYAWSQDYLLGYKNQNKGNGDAGWSGYYYGPDSFVFALGGSYWGERFEFSGRAFYMAHGEKGRGDKAENYTFEGFNTADTARDYSLSGIVEHSFIFSFEGSYAFCDYFSIRSGLAYSHQWNFRNQKGLERDNIQCVFGLSFKLGV